MVWRVGLLTEVLQGVASQRIQSTCNASPPLSAVLATAPGAASHYLPDFEENDLKSKQFVFRLLAQALRQNPESLQTVINEVLSLKPGDQEELAELLRKTSFPAIITSAKTVANRLDFLIGLENLVFEKDTKKKLLERDQHHKILENEAWIFDENFTLSGSEERLGVVVEKHIGILGRRGDFEKSHRRRG